MEKWTMTDIQLTVPPDVKSVKGSVINQIRLALEGWLETKGSYEINITINLDAPVDDELRTTMGTLDVERTS